MLNWIPGSKRFKHLLKTLFKGVRRAWGHSQTTSLNLWGAADGSEGKAARVPVAPVAGNVQEPISRDRNKQFLLLMRGYGFDLLFGLLLLFPGTVLSIVHPLLAGRLIDQHLIPRLTEGMYLLMGLWAIAALVEKGLVFAGEWWFFRLQQRATFTLQESLFSRVLHFPKTFFDQHRVGEITSRLSDDIGELRVFFSSELVHLIENALRLTFALSLLFVLEWRLAAVVLALLVMMAFLAGRFATRLENLAHRELGAQARAEGDLHESLSSIKLLKAFSSEKQTLKRLRIRLRQTLRSGIDYKILSSFARATVVLLPLLAQGGALVLGGWWVITGIWTVGTLAAFQFALRAVTGPSVALVDGRLQLSHALAALDRVTNLFAMTVEDESSLPVSQVRTSSERRSADSGHQATIHEGAAETGSRLRLRGQVDFEEVSFDYSGRESVLQNVSFQARPGEWLGICGSSGVGKTTLISLLLRFYRPKTGVIRFDGRDVDSISPQALRRCIGYVPQMPILMSGSLLDNLRLGCPEATEEQVRELAERIGIDSWVRRWPQGYHTRVGEGGVDLSEGQKQRLALLRALMHTPDILILDEPVSALDEPSIAKFSQGMRAIADGRTVFLVTHHPELLRKTDSILLLQQGGHLLQGTSSHLLNSSVEFRTLMGKAV